MTSAVALVDEPLNEGRNGAPAGFGSVATRTPLTPQTATALTPLMILSARVPSVIDQAVWMIGSSGKVAPSTEVGSACNQSRMSV